MSGVLALAACGPAPTPPSPPVPADGWYVFEGTGTAAGRRHTLSLGGDRRASLVELKGSMLLAGPSRPGVGFRGEAIVLSDSATGVVGRAVWTDEKGDQAFSELSGTGTGTGARMEGTFAGGTGRYAGATGTYTFTWQYMLETEDGTVQGRMVDLTGRVRFGPTLAAPRAEAAKP